MKKIAWTYAVALVIFAAFARQTLQTLKTLFPPVFICISPWIVFALVLLALLTVLFKKSWASPLVAAAVFSFLIVLLLLVSIKKPEERMHLFIYGFLGFIFAFDDFREKRPEAFIRACVFCFFVAIIDEAFQYILPSRIGDLRDIGFGTTGGVWGATVALLLSSTIRGKR